MIKALIVEDELPARKKLKKYIESYHEPITVVDEFETVEEVLQFFESTSDIDLISSVPVASSFNLILPSAFSFSPKKITFFTFLLSA